MEKKSRRGSETRQRTTALNIRLLPSEHQAMCALAERAGHRSVQAWIRETLNPHLESVRVQG